jgi:hypothetical protein
MNGYGELLCCTKKDSDVVYFYLAAALDTLRVPIQRTRYRYYHSAAEVTPTALPAAEPLSYHRPFGRRCSTRRPSGRACGAHPYIGGTQPGGCQTRLPFSS